MNNPSFSILLVEDNPGDARLIQEMLRDGNLNAYGVYSEERLDSAIAIIHRQHFDIIILDLNLPDSAGFETLTKMTDATGGTVPIIILTGLNDEALGESAICCGAEDYLVKGDVRPVQISRSIRYAVERKRAELSLRESEVRFRSLHESMIDAFVQVDMRGKIVGCNETFLEMTGYTFDELKELTYENLTPEKWHDIETDIIRTQILKTGFSAVYEKEYYRKDGTVFPVELRTSLLSGAGKKPVGMWAIVRDITQRKKTESSLIENERRLNAAQEVAKVGDWVFDPETLAITWSDQMYRMYDRDPHSGPPDSREEEAYYTSEHVEIRKKLFRHVMETGENVDYEFTAKLANGKTPVFAGSIRATRDLSGRVTRLFGTIQDITEKNFALDLLKARLDLLAYAEHHTLQQTLVRTLDEVERLTSSSASFLYFTSKEHTTLTIQAWSSRTAEAFTMEEIGRNTYPIADNDVRKECVEKRKAVLHNDTISLQQCNSLPPCDILLTREMILPVVRNNVVAAILRAGDKREEYTAGDISVAGYLIDIAWSIVEKTAAADKLLMLNAELETRVQQRTSELQEAVKALESFSFSVSHDLRAPLRHIIGFFDLLRGELGELPGENSKHYIEMIDTSISRMNSLIDDLLSFSKMGRTALNYGTVNMDALVTDVLEEYADEIQKGNLSIIRKPYPAIFGDSAMMRVVLVNLISNAIKYTSKTEHPEMEIGYTDTDGSPVFSIRDNGAGFDMHYADKLFGVFQRMHTDRDFKGTGIGLSIVKSIIDRHHGKIWADRRTGEGCILLL